MGEIKSYHDLKYDELTDVLNMIDYPHHEVHDGNHYFMEGYIELNNGGKYFVKLETPDTMEWAHFKWEIESTGVLTTTLDEDASAGMSGGSSVVPLNNNRNSANTSGIVITGNTTSCTTYVTRVSNQKFGVAATPSKAVGGGAAREDELILKQGTVYCRSYTSGSDSNIINFKANWYEHE